MLITIYANLRIGTPLGKKFDSILPYKYNTVYKENAFSIGNVFDRKHAEPVDRTFMTIAMDRHKNMFCGRWLSGELEVLGDRVEQSYIVVKDIVLVNGDILLGEEKANSNRAAKAFQGLGILDWLWYCFKMLIGSRLSTTKAYAASQVAKQHGCDKIIMADMYCSDIQYVKINDVHVWCVPRGRTQFDTEVALSGDSY